MCHRTTEKAPKSNAGSVVQHNEAPDLLTITVRKINSQKLEGTATWLRAGAHQRTSSYSTKCYSKDLLLMSAVEAKESVDYAIAADARWLAPQLLHLLQSFENERRSTCLKWSMECPDWTTKPEPTKGVLPMEINSRELELADYTWRKNGRTRQN